MTGHRGTAAGLGERVQSPPARACLARVSIAEVARNRAAVLADAFDPSEVPDMAGRPDRSVAGRLALKHALVDLWAFLVPGLSVVPRDFVVGRDTGGAPVLRAAPGLAPDAVVRTSISHSPSQAVGLAAARIPGETR